MNWDPACTSTNACPRGRSATCRAAAGAAARKRAIAQVRSSGISIPKPAGSRRTARLPEAAHLLHHQRCAPSEEGLLRAELVREQGRRDGGRRSARARRRVRRTSPAEPAAVTAAAIVVAGGPAVRGGPPTTIAAIVAGELAVRTRDDGVDGERGAVEEVNVPWVGKPPVRAGPWDQPRPLRWTSVLFPDHLVVSGVGGAKRREGAFHRRLGAPGSAEIGGTSTLKPNP